MRLPNRRAIQGMVLPSLTLLTMVLVILTTALLMSGTSSLRVATRHQQSEVAIYAAESGLAQASEEYRRTGKLNQGFSDTLPESQASFVVHHYENTTDDPMPIPGGPVIPPGTIYLLSEGKSGNNVVRKAGALFHGGLGAFQAGLITEGLTASKSTFDAYNSALNSDPSLSKQPQRGILASNRVDFSQPEPQFTLEDTSVDGALFVAAGTTTADGIVRTGKTRIDREGVLDEPITLEAVVVPKVTKGKPVGGQNVAEGGVSDIDLSTYSPLPWSLVQGTPTELQVSYNPISQRFVFTDLGQPGPSASLSVTDFRTKSEAGGKLNLKFGPNTVSLDFDQDPPNIAYEDKNATQSGFQASGNTAFPPILTNVLNPSVMTTDNPDALGEGEYKSVTISDSTATDLGEGTYVIENLDIVGQGRLRLPPDKKATIYVTGRFTASGQNALVNETLIPPNLKIYYTGDQPVTLAGGSQSYLTLFAPLAEVELTGPDPDQPSTFYGALVGKTVKVINAAFHYDVATEGVGTGTDGSVLLLLNRHRL